MVNIVPSQVTFEQELFGVYFADVAKCLSLMKGTKCIAGGGAVLRAFLRGAFWWQNELIFFVSREALMSDGQCEWHDYLKSQGYSLCSGHNGDGQSECVFAYENNGIRCKVWMIVTECDPLEHIMRTAWGTPVLNIATWEGMYCLFPEITLGQRQMVVRFKLNEGELRAYDLYAARGFRRVRYDQVRDEQWTDKARFFGDDDTVRVGFSQTPDLVERLDDVDLRLSVTALGLAVVRVL
jgi:hypothetical protein